MRRLRVAVVGLGWVATHRHLPALLRNRDIEVVGVIDRDAAKAKAVAAQFRIGRCAGTPGSPGDVEWLEQVDAVTIAAPPTAHHALGSAWLDAGRDVLLEKPMAMSVAEARDLEGRAAAAGRTLGVVHNFQFASSVRRAQTLLARGRLGKLTGLWGIQLSNPRRRLPTWYEDLPNGLFYDESPHFLYLVQALAGTPARLRESRIEPSSTGRRTPYRVSAALDAGGVPVQLDMAFEAPISEWQLAVLGSEAAAIIDVFRDILVVVPNDGLHTATDIVRTSAAAVGQHLVGTAASGLRLVGRRLLYGNDEVVRRFVAATRDHRAPAGIGAADGVRVVELQHALMGGG